MGVLVCRVMDDLNRWSTASSSCSCSTCVKPINMDGWVCSLRVFFFLHTVRFDCGLFFSCRYVNWQVDIQAHAHQRLMGLFFSPMLFSEYRKKSFCFSMKCLIFPRVIDFLVFKDDQCHGKKQVKTQPWFYSIAALMMWNLSTLSYWLDTGGCSCSKYYGAAMHVWSCTAVYEAAAPWIKVLVFQILSSKVGWFTLYINICFQLSWSMSLGWFFFLNTAETCELFILQNASKIIWFVWA